MILQTAPLKLRESMGKKLSELAQEVDTIHRGYLKTVSREGRKRNPNQNYLDGLKETYERTKKQQKADTIPQIQKIRQGSGLEELNQAELEESVSEFVGQIEHARREEEYGTTGIDRVYRFIRKHPKTVIGAAAIVGAAAAILGLELTYPIFDIYDRGFGRSWGQIINDPLEATKYFSDRISIRGMLWDTSWVYLPQATIAGGIIGGASAWGLRKRAKRKGSLDKRYHIQTNGLIGSYAENYANGTLTPESQREAALNDQTIQE